MWKDLIGEKQEKQGNQFSSQLELFAAPFQERIFLVISISAAYPLQPQRILFLSHNAITDFFTAIFKNNVRAPKGVERVEKKNTMVNGSSNAITVTATSTLA